MNNNDILRRVRYIFDFDDSKMIAVFGLAGVETSRAEISDWLKKDDDPAFQNCPDTRLAAFLNGLITDRRGKREGALPPVEKTLTNNMVFKKLKIALDQKSEDVLDTLKLAGFQISAHELSAFFRKPGHKHYRECKDQVMRNYLQGLQLKYQNKVGPDSPSTS